MFLWSAIDAHGMSNISQIVPEENTVVVPQITRELNEDALNWRTRLPCLPMSWIYRMNEMMRAPIVDSAESPWPHRGGTESRRDSLVTADPVHVNASG